MTEQKENIAELSEEDQQLKEKLDLMVEKLQEGQTAENSLKLLEDEVRGATTSMTSIPKPLKFLKPHYPTLKTLYSNMQPSPLKVRLANFLSVLALSMATEERECLNFLLEGDRKLATEWGHEYVRNLCGEIRDEFLARMEKEADRSELIELVDIVVPFLIKHHSETEAVDLLGEVDNLEKIIGFVEVDNYKRICQYVSSTALYAADTDEMVKTLKVCMQCYIRAEKYPEALRIALKINRPEVIDEAMKACKDPVTLKQMCYLLARQRVNYETEDENLSKIISNEFLTEAFVKLATELDTLEPKTPDDIYKSHLEERGRRPQTSQIDSSKQNLASTIVNAFVNVGYCNDALMFNEDKKWIFHHKDWGQLTAAASLGMLLLWNVDEGISKIDKYQYSREDFIRGGAFMGFGIVNSGIRNEMDPAMAILTEALDNANEKVLVGTIAGFSMAYAGSAREDVLEVLSPFVIDTSVSLESSALAALALGLVFVGTCNDDVVQAILQTLTERSETELGSCYARFFALGIGLVFLGQQDLVQTTLSIIEDLVGEPIKKYAKVTIESCAYAGSGNVLKVQEMLHECAEHLEEKDCQHQMVAVLGVSLIAMGENIGSEMVLRMFEHLLQYGEQNIKRAVPLAIALMNVSNPQVNVIDILSKLSHDVDSQTAHNAIFALGMVGAGTNNSRLAGTLRQLAGFYSMEDKQLFMVRIAQGLLHLGKGLMTLDPYQSERFLLSPVALGGIITVLHTMLDSDNLIHEHSHYLLLYLALATYPRMLVTVDENLEGVATQVRVGTAVDVVGQAGQPRSITGFQTHTTPVLLSYGERAELATEEYIPCMEILDNFIILRKNPNYEPE